MRMDCRACMLMLLVLVARPNNKSEIITLAHLEGRCR